MKSLSPPCASPRPLSAPVSRKAGKVCFGAASSWVSALAPRTRPCPSTQPRWHPTESVAPSSCSGSYGLLLVSCTVQDRPHVETALTGAGIFLGFAANIIVKDTGKIAWRLQFGSAFIPSFILLCGIWFCPESPRWLMKHNKFAEGFKSMQRLRAHDIIAARDYYYSYINYEEEKKVANGAGYFARLKDCFTVPRIRRANYGASTVMLAQQMCGINSELIPRFFSRRYPCRIVLTLNQSFRFTALPFSRTSATARHRLCMHRLATELCRLCLQSPHCS